MIFTAVIQFDENWYSSHDPLHITLLTCGILKVKSDTLLMKYWWEQSSLLSSVVNQQVSWGSAQVTKGDVTHTL